MESPLKDFPDVCIVLSAEDRILAINQAGEQLLRVTSSDVIGKTLAEVCVEQSLYLIGVGFGETSPRFPGGLVDFGEVKVWSARDADGNMLGSVAIIHGLTPTAEQEALRNRNEMLVALQETTFDLHSSLELKVVLRNIVMRACKLLRTTHGYLAVLRETGEMKAVVGVGALASMRKFKITSGVDVAGTVWKTGKPLFVPNYDRWPDRIKGFPHGWIRPILGMPLILKEQVTGVICIARGNESENSFSEEDINLLWRFADLAVLALQNARLFQQAQAEITFRRKTEIKLRNTNQVLQFQLERIELLQKQLQDQAIRDSLTGLFNRRYLQEALEAEFARAKRSKNSLAILMMDCDRLKYINDTYGHKAGDDALVHIANVINENIRAGDIACRYGGDEFVVMLGNVTEEIAFDRAEDLRNRIAAGELVHNGEQVIVCVSAGIAIFPDHGEQGELLLHRADQALYAAKHEGKNQVLVYSEKLE